MYAHSSRKILFKVPNNSKDQMSCHEEIDQVNLLLEILEILSNIIK